ncbi:MAG TPA: acetyl-CoA carboxylase carboxyltransferase subunit alpha [Pseudomonadota bacterium]|jgi:acetyl-CoA carboxylase carboxyl transferase subunit alpha|nr:acetyl-CoA carboxylase carboxyltransferase subunit alpha [Pseudomonadota bacterium]HNN50144.1 acetyl-CoA carboxylase carboxyltransferase subunit alpha [Pseudomonadota bacterium]HNO70083.1 acetyl-CoA carboxylase carboxyltransferase subunit alpha [Pseudomonadota bacterium]
MVDPRQSLEFERPLVELENKIAELKQLAGGELLAAEIKILERRASRVRAEIYSNLSPWQKVQLSRHPLRPYTLDYVSKLCSEFFELHGDRAFSDDEAVVGGLARLTAAADRPVLLIGHQKGRGTKEAMRRNFGMPRPEGYRKGRRLMELAARMKLPIVSLIDTPGAFPGIDAEERGQAEAIAKNLEVMAGLPVPIVSVVIGEGGSGGALALGVCDRLLMLEYSVYSVITPEGCASILWKDQAQVEVAASQLKMTADDLNRLGVTDEIIAEPPGGAHHDLDEAARRVGEAVARHLADLSALSPSQLLDGRYAKYRAIGSFIDTASPPA